MLHFDDIDDDGPCIFLVQLHCTALHCTVLYCTTGRSVLAHPRTTLKHLHDPSSFFYCVLNSIFRRILCPLDRQTERCYNTGALLRCMVPFSCPYRAHSSVFCSFNVLNLDFGLLSCCLDFYLQFALKLSIANSYAIPTSRHSMLEMVSCWTLVLTSCCSEVLKGSI